MIDEASRAPGFRRLALVLALGAAFVLVMGWMPGAESPALREQSALRLVRADAETAAEGGDSLFAQLARIAPGETLRFAAPEHATLEQAFESAWRGFATRRPAGWVPFAPAGPGEAARVVRVSLLHDGEGVRVRARLDAAPEGALPELGPRALPTRSALLPPLVAIGIALVWRRTLLALFGGVWVALVAQHWIDGAGAAALWRGSADVVGVYFLREVFDSFRIEILGFIVALLAMVGVISRAGGVAGLVGGLRGYATTARSAQLVTWASGLVIFFDDYANCMLVGNTLRPLTDRLRVSREKLAYLVDSTAAPVAGLSLFSTWIAFQVSVFEPALPAAGIDASGYALFVWSIPYHFYCWLALFFGAAVAASGRDFGPMARAEQRARRTGALHAPGAHSGVSEALARLEPAAQMPANARLALIPIGITVAATALGILWDGGALALLRAPTAAWRSLESWSAVLLAGGGAAPIFRGALVGLFAALFLAGTRAVRVALVAVGGASAVVGAVFGLSAIEVAGGFALGLALWGWVGRRMKPAAATRTPVARLDAGELVSAATAGRDSLLFAIALLFGAWMIGAVCADLGSADVLVAGLTPYLSPAWLPPLLFVGAAGVAFATGSSWSTMSILLPNAVPLAAALGGGGPETLFWVVLSISAVLDGAIFGDHCSPISDTTVLSSLASGCDHLDHVRTQAPYALGVAAVALAFGYGPLAAGLPWGAVAGLGTGALLLWAALRHFGAHSGDPPAAGA